MTTIEQLNVYQALLAGYVGVGIVVSLWFLVTNWEGFKTSATRTAGGAPMSARFLRCTWVLIVLFLGIAWPVTMIAHFAVDWWMARRIAEEPPPPAPRPATTHRVAFRFAHAGGERALVDANPVAVGRAMQLLGDALDQIHDASPEDKNGSALAAFEVLAGFTGTMYASLVLQSASRSDLDAVLHSALRAGVVEHLDNHEGHCEEPDCMARSILATAFASDKDAPSD